MAFIAGIAMIYYNVQIAVLFLVVMTISVTASVKMRSGPSEADTATA
jgi:hypothetical protein